MQYFSLTGCFGRRFDFLNSALILNSFVQNVSPRLRMYPKQKTKYLYINMAQRKNFTEKPKI
uniref:Uncharacterized protein n=1 Tax=Romanomermis culicivorax TaxID=13658 RepID=A0A915IIB3_ROMCU